MNEEPKVKFDPNKPFIALYAVLNGPDKVEIETGEEAYLVEILASGPLEHDTTRTINVWYDDLHAALEDKKEIDFAFDEPVKKNIVGMDENEE